MATGIKIENSEGSIVNDVELVGFDTAIDLVGSNWVSLKGILVRPNTKSFEHLKLYGSKVGLNDICPCGSGVKFKNCKGASSMSTGIRSDSSTFTVGKATIVAEIGIDLKNNSKAHIDELNFYSTDTSEALVTVLKQLPVQPPYELVVDALDQQKSVGSIEDSKLWDWFQKQGINLAFWPQIAVAIASLV